MEFQYGTNAVDLRISSTFIYQKVVLDVRVPLSKNVFKMFEFGSGHFFHDILHPYIGMRHTCGMEQPIYGFKINFSYTNLMILVGSIK